MPVSLLADWGNFYVITGSSAAALTGLTFVVIALAANTSVTTTVWALHAFVTPTIVHFGTVLALAAFLSVPHQSLMSLSLGLGVAGVGGLVYGLIIGAIMRRHLSGYIPVREDWLWHAILPTLAYGALLGMAFLIWRCADQSLYGVAAISMLLLYIGIHNAWDVAVSISLRKQQDSPSPKAQGSTAAPE
jgi:hypothetical protein